MRVYVTDAKLVHIKRVPENEHLLVADAIPWIRRGNGQLAVLFGLWYLGVLAEGSYWQLFKALPIFQALLNQEIQRFR